MPQYPLKISLKHCKNQRIQRIKLPFVNISRRGEVFINENSTSEQVRNELDGLRE
jgi:hypothetical protein